MAHLVLQQHQSHGMTRAGKPSLWIFRSAQGIIYRYSAASIFTLSRSDRKKTSLLDYDGGSLRRDVEAKNAILLTWQISFGHIRHARSSAADLLSLMSFFDRQGIPEELVRSQEWSESEDESSDVINADEKDSDSDSDSDSDNSESEASIDDSFEEDIAMLRDYSLIALTTDRTTFDIHRLVQLATRKWIKENGHLETWKERYITNLNAAFPAGNFENWAQCEPLYPHAKAALLQQPKSKKSLVKWDYLLYHAAQYAFKKGNLSDAEEFSVRSIEICEQLFGEENQSTLITKGLFRLVLKYTGRSKEAEELELQVVEIRKRVLGEEHPGTLTSMNNLASTYRHQGRWKEAEELKLQVLEIRKRVLGEEHPDTLRSIGNLAATYWNQGRWKEAEELSLQVVEISKRVLGEKHPDTLTSINNLAHTLYDQGRTAEAMQLMETVVQVKKRVLGPQHPSFLNSSSVLKDWRREEMQLSLADGQSE
ncbi:TPR-like protein [Lizonia empirigonia]|nr:TPR-like protein [Lizonia empirigonia]